MRFEEPARATSPVRLLLDAADAVPDQQFLDFAGDAWTYAGVREHVAALATGLRRRGVQKGDTVACMLDNNAEAVATWFASNLIGAIWVGVNTALRGTFLSHVLIDSGARIIICEPDFEQRLAALSELGAVELIVVREPRIETDHVLGCATTTLSELASEANLVGLVDASPSDVSLLVYTGGTTGPSKGCVVSHGYTLSLARAFLRQTARQPDEVNWSPLPTYHFNLIGNTITSTLLLRGTASISPRFSVSGFWPEIARSGAKIVNLLGSMGTLIAQMEDTAEMADCKGQIRVVHGAPFSPEVQEVWRQRYGVTKVGGMTYGLTEAVPLTTLDYRDPEPPGSSGVRNDEDFDVRVFDDDDRELGPGEVGEIVARPRHPNVMFKGYWNRPQATVDACRDLWFRTGDLGMFDDDGFFYFVDRKKDYLRRRGENISSQEMEATLLQHPDVEQVAVHAVASSLSEDDVKVTAVIRTGARLSAEHLFEWSKPRVPYFALPRYIEFRPQLPTSAVGRVHKHMLRDEGVTEATWDRETADVSWERR